MSTFKRFTQTLADEPRPVPGGISEARNKIGGKIPAQVFQHREGNFQPLVIRGQAGKSGEIAPVAEQPQVGGDDLDCGRRCDCPESYRNTC